MKQREFEALKKDVEETYKGYIRGQNLIVDVAKYFHIPVDEDRLDDYFVEEIDCFEPLIKVVDKKKSRIYTSFFTTDAELLNYCSKQKKFISVRSLEVEGIKNILYYVGDDNPIISRMTFENEQYTLTLERERENSIGTFHNNGLRTAIHYSKKLESQDGFHNVYVIYDKEDTLDQVLELNSYTVDNDRQTKYSYVRCDNVIYVVNELRRKNICNYLQGVCLENTNIPSRDCFPFNINKENYPFLKNDDVSSAMMFEIGTIDNVFHTLEVYKNKDVVNITYHSKRGRRFRDTVVEYQYSIENLVDGTITSDEIQNVLSSLNERLDNDVAMNIISDELNNFATKIDIRKGMVDEFNPLDSKNFIDKSFDEIWELVSCHRDDYFQLVDEEFKMFTNHDLLEDNVDVETKEYKKVIK